MNLLYLVFPAVGILLSMLFVRTLYVATSVMA